MNKNTSKKPKKERIVINKKMVQKTGFEVYSPKLPKKIISRNGAKNK